MTGMSAMGDDRVRRVRLTRLLAYDIAANIAGLLLLAAVYLWICRSVAAGVLAGMVAAHLLVDLVLLRRRSPAQDRPAVAVITASTWLITLGVTPIVPAVFPVMAVTSLYPVVLAVPYLTRRRFPLLACLLVAVNASLAAESRSARCHRSAPRFPAGSPARSSSRSPRSWPARWRCCCGITAPG